MSSLIKLLANSTLVFTDDMTAWEIFKLKFEVGLIEASICIGIIIVGFILLKLIVFVLGLIEK